MIARTVVALDLGGILLTDPTLGAYWTEVAGGDAARGDAVRQLWFEHVREPLERGEIEEQEAWSELAKSVGGSPARFRDLFLSRFFEIPGGVAALRRCHDAGLRTVLATNHYSPWLQIWQERFDWFAYLDPIVCSSELGSRKPEAAFYKTVREACQELGQRVVFVDDVRVNVDAANASGLDGVLGDASGDWWKIVVDAEP